MGNADIPPGKDRGRGVAIVIPARFASTRLPGKLLLKVDSRPVIRYVWERASRSTLAERVVIATDDERILAAASGFGAEVLMTSVDCASGTDRIGELVGRGALDASIIVNVQGDEPEIDPAAIDEAVRLLLDDPSADIATLAVPVTSPAEYCDPNAVKVVVSSKGFALYFSRAQVPFVRGGVEEGADFAALGIYRHVGLYAYRRAALVACAEAPQSRLERLEKLEQLRALEMGLRIKVAVMDSAPRGIDTREDFEAFAARQGTRHQKESSP